MSRKCDHDWFDHYMMYSMMSNKAEATILVVVPSLHSSVWG